MIHLANNIVHSMIRKNSGRDLGRRVIITTPSVAYTHQWKSNEASGNLLDSLGSLHLTANGTPGTIVGKVGNARSYNGTTDFFKVNVPSDTIRGNDGIVFNPVCLSVWFYPTNLTGKKKIYGCWRNAGGGAGYITWYELMIDSGTLKFIDSNYAAGSVTEAMGTITINTWNHLAIRGDIPNGLPGASSGTPVYRYRLNGGSVVQFNGLSKPLVLADATGNFVIGGDTGDPYGVVFQGYLDSVIANTSSLWSDADLLTLYNSGNGLEL